MPLDPLQERIIRTALGLPQARTLALAGGCAVIVHGLVDRSTRDVDLFTERDAGEALELCVALRTVLAEARLRIEPAARPPHENRFVAVEPGTGAEMVVEVFSDGGLLAVRGSDHRREKVATHVGRPVAGDHTPAWLSIR